MSINILEEIINKKDNVAIKPDIKLDNKSNEEKENDLQVKKETTEIINDKIDDKIDNKTDDIKKSESLIKALNDTKRSYQTVNQKFVLSKKKYKSVIDELKNSLLNSENTLLDEDDFNTAINKLTSIFDVNDEELETKEESKEVSKNKNILDKLENEYKNYKKYNNSKDIDNNYQAFYKSIHLLDTNEKENLLDYLEEADSTDAIKKILLMGEDYRNIFETGLKKHKNIFAFVNNLQEEILTLKEEINKYKLSVDNSFDKTDNKQIKHRTSPIDYKNKSGSDLLEYIIGKN